MPKLRNLAALAAAVEAGRRYARSHPEQAGKYVDQAAAFIDKQTKGKYAGQIDGVAGKVKSAAGLPRTSRTVQGFEANAGYGRHEGYGAASTTTATPSTPSPSTPSPSATSPTSPSPGPSATVPPVSVPPVKTPPVTTPPTSATPTSATSTSATSTTVDPEGTGDAHFPGSKDL